MSIWYETCVSQDGQIRDVMVRACLQSAKRASETLRIAWPNFDMIFIRQHGHKRRNRTSQESFRVLHKLTIKRQVA